LVWVSHLWIGSGFGKFPLKVPNFSIFSLLDKKYLQVRSKVPRSKTGPPLIYCEVRPISTPKGYPTLQVKKYGNQEGHIFFSKK